MSRPEEVRAVGDAAAAVQQHLRLALRLATLSPGDIRCPTHDLSVIRDRIDGQDLCPPGEHDWIDLTGAPSAEWRECRNCGLADSTLADLGGSPLAETKTD